MTLQHPAAGFEVGPADLATAAGRLEPVTSDAAALRRDLEQVRGGLAADAWGEVPQSSQALREAFLGSLSRAEADATETDRRTAHLAGGLDRASVTYRDGDADAGTGYLIA